jgi:hypothetical protein
MGPGACTIKLFKAVIVGRSYYARVFVTAIHFNPTIIFSSNDNTV